MTARRQLLGAAGAWLLAAGLVLGPLRAGAQSAGRMRRIGVLANVPGVQADRNPLLVFVETLRNLGWVEGRTVAFEYRYAEQHYERFPELARQLVALGVDLIVVTSGVTAALAAKAATSTIPIVAIAVADPVKFGLVDSFARPGGNVTGNMQPLPDWGKALELAQEAVTGATRVAVIGNPTNVVYADYVAQNEAAARALGLKLQMIPVASREDLGPAFEAMQRGRAEVLVFGPDSVFLVNLDEILARARTLRLPVIGPFRPAAVLGAVATFNTDVRPAYRQAAAYADRILRGARPADLPIEQAMHMELIVNARAAQALGLTLPKALLLRADEVLE